MAPSLPIQSPNIKKANEMGVVERFPEVEHILIHIGTNDLIAKKKTNNSTTASSTQREKRIPRQR